MLTVTKTSNDNTVQTVQLPSTLSGTLYIRVVDTDRTPGNRELSTVYIDWMYIESIGTPPSQKMHVSNIDMTTETKSAGPNIFTKAIATVTIMDSLNNPVSSATVYGQWSGLTTNSDQGTTDGTGKVSIESDQVKNACDWYKFCVTDAAKTGWTYEPDKNVETCDSVYWCGSGSKGYAGGTNFQVIHHLTPLDNEAVITYSLSAEDRQTPQHVAVKIYNISGQVIKTLVDEEQIAGLYETHWNSRDEADMEVPNGTYFCRFAVNGRQFVGTKKILVLK